MHKLDENLLNNTYRIQAPVSFNEHGENVLKVLSYQTDKVYDIHLQNSNDLKLTTFFRLCHEADIRNEVVDTNGETMVVDRNII